MTRRRPLAFWLILALAVAAAIVWVFYVPYREERLFAAIPGHATLVSVHDRPAARLDELLANPLFRSALLSAGVREADLKSLATDPETRRWAWRLARHKGVLAYVPRLGPRDQPAWVFSSWLGPSSRWLRWWLQTTPGRTFRPLRFPGAIPIWLVRTKFSDPRLQLSITITDGLLVGAISRDPLAARHVLATSERHPWSPSVVSQGRLAAARKLWQTEAPDRGWLAWPLAWSRPTFAPSMAALEITVAPDGSLKAAVSADAPLPLRAASTASATNALRHVLRDAPELMVTLPASALRLFLPAGSAGWADALRQIVPEATPGAPDSSVALCILSRDYSGRIRGPISESLTPFMKGLKVPTLLLAIEVPPGLAGDTRMRTALDRLNAAYRLGLVPHPVQFDEQPLVMLDDTQSSFYGKFEPEERISYAEADGWLLIGSNMSILRRLLAESATALPAEPARWVAGLPAAPAAAWSRLDTASRTLTDAFAAATLAMLIRDADGTAAVRGRLANARAWLEVLNTLEQGSLALSVTNGVSRAEIQLTAAPRAAAPTEPAAPAASEP